MENFNSSIYLALNNDLKMSKYSNANMAKFHFTNYGYNEGRPFLVKDLFSDFRTEYYNALNLDLQKYKMKPSDLELHFLTKGRFESRLYKPPKDYDLVYLYTDNINYNRAEYYDNILKSIGIQSKIVTEGILNTNSLYILFTHRQIKLYPFYFLLCLENYDVPKILMDLSCGIIVEKVEKIDEIKQYINKINLCNSQNLCKTITDSQGISIDDDYLFKRLLIGHDTPKIELEFKLDSNKIYCLAQPEHAFRMNKFMNQRYKADNLEFIVGVKNPIGWIGSVLSYKNIIHSAIKQELPYITICHDDIVFKETSMNLYRKIIEYLNKNTNWDVFVGIMNITDPYIRILNKIKIDDGIELLQVDMFDNLAFNIYRSSIFEKIKDWDSKYRMYPEDTLPKYLQKNRLVVLTINPFLVDYNYDVSSTISRNKKNEMEMNKIRICENNLSNKKLYFK